MAKYISEFQYLGDSSIEFIEVAVDAGTDVSGYQIVLYQADGTQYASFGLGSYTATISGHDVYLLDDSTSGFTVGDEMGNLWPDDAIALVDGGGTVVQFVSYWDNTVTAVDGPASGLTSTDVGTAINDDSLQTNDQGATYFSQSSQNPGSIPACYAKGTKIQTPDGLVAIEELSAGDLVLNKYARPVKILSIWAEKQVFSDEELHQMPVLIRRGALRDGCPSSDLIVSGQHRIAVGLFDQLQDVFPHPALIPAKALVGAKGVGYLTELQEIEWFHILCDEHELIWANDMLSETMFLGQTLLRNIDGKRKKAILDHTSSDTVVVDRFATALPCLSVGDAKDRLRNRTTFSAPQFSPITLH